MNLIELKAALDTAKVPKSSYSFTSDGCGEIYRIAPIHDLLGDGWEVYYSERGIKSQLLTFRSEAEACEEFLRWIRRDSTLRHYLSAQ